MAQQSGRSDAGRYRRLKRAGWLAAVVYIAVAALPKPFRTGQPEFFPFFSWSLFSNIPNDTRDYGVRVLAFDGRVLDPPRFLAELEPYIRGGGAGVVHNEWQLIGRALDQGRASEANTRRLALERGLFKKHSVSYELLRREYLYYDLILDGTLLDERSLGRFDWPGRAP